MKSKIALVLAVLPLIVISACSKIEGNKPSPYTSELTGSAPVYIDIGSGYLAKKINIDGTECVIIVSKYSGNAVSPTASCKW